MNPDLEQKLKASQAAYENQANTIGGIGSAIGYDCATPAQDMLTERFRSRLRRAYRDENKNRLTHELVGLLEKHPDVARILDLIDALGRD